MREEKAAVVCSLFRRKIFLKIFEVFHCHVAEKHYLCAVLTKNALVVELVDTPDLGSGAARRVSSSLIRRTKEKAAG